MTITHDALDLTVQGPHSIHGTPLLVTITGDLIKLLHSRTSPLQYRHLVAIEAFLPPAKEVWGKVMFLHQSVILFTGPGLASQHASQVT